MKKKIIILATVAVSGLAAVVASNTNKMFGANDAEANNCIEVINGVIKKGCIGEGGLCLFWTGSTTVFCTGKHF